MVPAAKTPAAANAMSLVMVQPKTLKCRGSFKKFGSILICQGKPPEHDPVLLSPPHCVEAPSASAATPSRGDKNTPAYDPGVSRPRYQASNCWPKNIQSKAPTAR